MGEIDDGGIDVQVEILITTVNTLQRQNEELKSEVIIFKQIAQSIMQQMNSSVKRFSMLLVARVIAPTARRIVLLLVKELIVMMMV